MPANLVFRRKIWGARDNGIPPRSTPVAKSVIMTTLLGTDLCVIIHNISTHLCIL